MATQPAHKIRDGVLQVVIWRNLNEKGAFYHLNIQRSFKRDDGTWGQTESLGSEDALPTAELLREAYAWIKMQKQADAKARKEQAAA